jgi:WD40 repeat protein
MKIPRLLIFSLAFLFGVVSCQVQTPTTQAPEVETPLPLPEISQSPAPAEEILINSENLGQLKLSSSMQASTGAIECDWSKDSKVISVTDITHTGLYEADTQNLLAEFTGDEYTALYSVSPDAGLAAYSLDGIKIQLYDFNTKADRISITPEFQYGNVFFSPDGSLLAVDSFETIEIVLFDSSTGTEVNRINGFETAAPVYRALFSPDGSTLLWISRGTAQAMNITTQKLDPAVSHEDFIAAAEISRDNNKIATAAAGTLNGEMQPLVTLWNSQDGQDLWQKGNPEYFSSLDFSMDNSLLAAGTLNEVVFYDVVSGKELSRLQTGEEVINSLGFSPDGTSLLTCSSSGIAATWKIVP